MGEMVEEGSGQPFRTKDLGPLADLNRILKPKKVVPKVGFEPQRTNLSLCICGRPVSYTRLRPSCICRPVLSRSVPRRLSAECQQIPIAGSDTNDEGACLLEQLPHGLAGGLPG